MLMIDVERNVSENLKESNQRTGSPSCALNDLVKQNSEVKTEKEKYVLLFYSAQIGFSVSI
jgi:hypothetical protein